MSSANPAQRQLLEAISFAARAHRGQMRKDRETPYASHPFRVCLIVRHVFGIDDTATLTAAVLHDTIEDTPADYDDLNERFGDQVAGWVGLLSKDMRMPEEEREKVYKAALAAAPWQVKVCKLADIYDNLCDTATLPPDKRRRSYDRSRGYLAVLDDPALPAAARQAYRLTTTLLQEIEGQPER
jgi:guanosine-3',5'-bis(diphosphate) 3'-pyrophosphohydrolase